MRLASIAPFMLPALLFVPAVRASLELTEFLIDGDDSWVELHHSGPNTFLAQGFVLKTGQASWTLPELHFDADEYIVIPLGEHLSLRRAGGDLVLLDASGNTLTSFLKYPRQRQGISFGLSSDESLDLRYFVIPTPGEQNGRGAAGLVKDTNFSVKGGFFEEPITLEITSATEGAQITYTLDGSLPGIFNGSTRVYHEPLTLTKTTVVRAMAQKQDHVSTNFDTQTYFFLADVVQQPDLPNGFPESWGDGPGVVSAMPGRSDYAMDPRVRNANHQDRDGASFTLTDSLRSAPSLSMVLPISSLFDEEIGLHALARNKGPEWERPMSLEYFNEQGERQFQIDGGFRMQGGWNRFPESFKKSFRFYFRSRYGEAKLEYPLFPDGKVSRFDTLILRSGNGKAWPSPWRPLTGSMNNSLERVTYMRDQLPRDLQRDMGHPTSHGTFVHFYINGLYWGLYNLVERVDEWFGPGYFGGDEDEYDVIKWIRSEGRIISAGNGGRWNQLLDLVRSDIDTQATYEAALQLVDPVNLIDYMLINFYIGNTDWPDNNAYTFSKRSDDGRFRFVCWDSEESLVGATVNSLTKNNRDTPAEVFQRLRRNDEFKILLADRISKHFSEGGILTDAHVAAAFDARARQIDRAVVGESARWGDLLRPQQPYTRSDWLRELDNLNRNFFGQDEGGSREDRTFEQLKNAGWVSSVNAPVISEPAGFLPSGTDVRIAHEHIFVGGTIYYTTDGADPRMAGGGLHPSARKGPVTLSITQSATINARNTLPGELWSGLVEAHYIVGSPASKGNVRITELMYHPVVDQGPEYVELTNFSSDAVNLNGSRFDDGIHVSFEDDVLLAPGEYAVITQDRAAFEHYYGPNIRVLAEFQNETRLSNGGETVAFKDHRGEVITSFRYDDAIASTDGGGHSLVLEGDQWLASAEAGGSPGLDADARLPDAFSFPRIEVVDGDRFLVIESGVDRFSFQLELSDDLVKWMAADIPATEGDGSVRWRLPASNHRYFARLRVHAQTD